VPASLFCVYKEAPCKAQAEVINPASDVVKLIQFQQKLFLSVDCASAKKCLPNSHEYHMLGLLLLLQIACKAHHKSLLKITCFVFHGLAAA